jgi:hypothetical protein
MRKNDVRQMIRPIAQYSDVVKDRVGQNNSEPQKSRAVITFGSDWRC